MATENVDREYTLTTDDGQHLDLTGRDLLALIVGVGVLTALGSDNPIDDFQGAALLGVGTLGNEGISPRDVQELTAKLAAFHAPDTSDRAWDSAYKSRGVLRS